MTDKLELSIALSENENTRAILDGRIAPAGTPPEIVARLNTAINEALAAPELIAALGKLGNRPLGGKPEDLTRKMQGDIARWAPVVKSLNLKGE